MQSTHTLMRAFYAVIGFIDCRLLIVDYVEKDSKETIEEAMLLDARQGSIRMKLFLKFDCVI